MQPNLEMKDNFRVGVTTLIKTFQILIQIIGLEMEQKKK